MSNQPEALRLADTFDHPLPPEWSDMQAAAAELRRLHAENVERRANLKRVTSAMLDADVLVIELLGALKYHQAQTRPIQRSIDAIAKAEGTLNDHQDPTL